MFKLRNFTILCTKWAHFKFDACYRSQNSWDGACLPWCSISSSFQNSLKTSGHRGYEFLEFWCWNLVPFLPDIGFQLLKSLWSSLTYFSFNDAIEIWRWGTLLLKYSTIFLHTLSQIGEPLPIFTSERLCLYKTTLL